MPTESHPRREELGRFVEGGLGAEDNRRVVRHLLTGCPTCRQIAAGLWRPPISDIGDVALDRAAVAASTRQAEVEGERAAVAGLLREVEAQPASRQLLLVLNSHRFKNWFLCEKLLERAFERGFEEPLEAVRMAEIGLALAGRIAETEPAERVNHDLVARAWAVLGNVRRVSSDLPSAEAAFGRAREELQRGSGDPLEEANVELLHGILRHGQRRFGEAKRCFDRAARLSKSAGDDHLRGKALSEKARTVGESGDTEAMIALLRRAVPLLDSDREPRLMLVVQHNLTVALNESGRLEEALASLQALMPMHARSAKPMDLLRLRSLEGKLAQAQGELVRAAAAFREVCSGFLERQVPYDAALSALDLAAVYYEQDELGEMKRLVAETLPVFRTLGIHREALAALTLFQQAVERERVSLRFIAELAAYLQRARSDSSLTFEPSV